MFEGKTIVVFDLETTGTDTKTAEIVQFAGLKIDKDNKESSLEMLIKPNNPIPNEASEVNGITNEMLDGKPSFKDVSSKVEEFITCDIICGYNHSNYDIPILVRSFKEVGVDISEKISKMVVYDAFPVFKKHNNNKLSSANRFYGFGELIDAHSAVADCQATLNIIKKQLEIGKVSIEEAAKVIEVDSKDDICGKIKIGKDGDGYFTFGKNKGIKVKDTEKTFLRWILSKEFEKPVKDYVKKFL